MVYNFQPLCTDYGRDHSSLCGRFWIWSLYGLRLEYIQKSGY